jgi:hypothetical protein
MFFKRIESFSFLVLQEIGFFRIRNCFAKYSRVVVSDGFGQFIIILILCVSLRTVCTWSYGREINELIQA